MSRPSRFGGGASLVILAALAARTSAAPLPVQDSPDPAAVRRLARQAGLAPLTEVRVPVPRELEAFLNPGAVPRRALLVLGKALFWDMQVGSDGQACGSCHFHAGADNRTKNQLGPGMKNVHPEKQGVFDPTATGAGGPNYELSAEDFPFHKLAVTDERDFDERVVLFDSDDVVSSQGVSRARFAGTSGAAELGTPEHDEVFHVGGVNTRRVEPRNTPTMINAVFNPSNFWDGRAHQRFNGVSVSGPLDQGARIHVSTWFGLEQRRVDIPHSSLASQAVGPPLSGEEMSFLDRSFPALGRKLLGLRPLGLQRVHPEDSVLGALARARLQGTEVVGAPGIYGSYSLLIALAFRPTLWFSFQRVGGHSLMEANFSLFFGLAIQAYEATLVADRSPFDHFMAGDDGALGPEELRGLLTFLRQPDSTDPAFTDEIGVGNCVACHGGPELTEAGFTVVMGAGRRPQFIENEPMAALFQGNLVSGNATAFVDHGFSNLGVRPTEDDLGRGGESDGYPLSFARQALMGLSFAPPLPGCGPRTGQPCPTGKRVSVDGAFKVPGLRNVALTGPYFHTGGMATLDQVVEFYDRRGDFGNLNIADVELNLARVTITEDDEEPLVAFLESLTDERVAWERGPFDHPEILVPNGHPGDHTLIQCATGMRACDDVLRVPAIGIRGRAAAGLEALEPFLGGEDGGE